MSKVYFVPKKVASSIRTPVNLISINDPYGSFAEFSVKHNLLKLGFINDYAGIQEITKRHLIQDEQIEKIIEFCKPIFEKGEDIIVHCGEGSVRSPAIANFISDLSGHFKCKLYLPSASYREHRGSDRHMCRYTYRTCVSYFAKKQTEGKTLLTQDVVSDMAREAGVEWSLLWNEIDYFRLPEGRRFIEEDVVKAIEKIQTASRARIHPSDSDMKPGSESAVESIGLTPRIVVTGMKDCSVGGCENCKKDKQ